jgi:hypothetical protein
MTRIIHHGMPISVNMGPLERALVGYYAHRYGRTKSDIIRAMIRKYSQSDRTFDANAFIDFVSSELIPGETTEKLEAKAILDAAKSFVDLKRKP